MDLFQCSTFFLALVVSFSAITTSKGSLNIIDSRSQSISQRVHNGVAFANFQAHEFSYLNITSIRTNYVVGGEECGFACAEIPSCFSYNLAASNDSNGRILCELLPSDKYNNSEKFVSNRLSFHHFSIVSPCMSGPCQNGGSCVSIYEENSYLCICVKGYAGSICQTDINDCASHPCKNNGTCIDRVNGFNCSCAPGFNGTQCETDIDDCASHPCKNNGTCTDQVNGFSCSCAPGSDGLQCETADICQNYKTLTDAERRYDHVTVNFKCDRTLNGWYRFQGAAGETMVTKCPPLGRCGAQFPAWLSEGHPPAAEGTVTRNVCIHGDKGCCDKSVLIQVRNCRSYYIYKLTPPVMCDTRYCSIE